MRPRPTLGSRHVRGTFSLSIVSTWTCSKTGGVWLFGFNSDKKYRNGIIYICIPRGKTDFLHHPSVQTLFLKRRPRPVYVQDGPYVLLPRPLHVIYLFIYLFLMIDCEMPYGPVKRFYGRNRMVRDGWKQVLDDLMFLLIVLVNITTYVIKR